MTKFLSTTRLSRHERRLIERIRAEALRDAAAIVLMENNSHPLVIRRKILELIPESQRDGCSNCGGLRGGVPGNENVVDGKLYCDYCDSELFTYAVCPLRKELEK